MKIDDEDDTTFSKSEYARGYKVVNGKKTSYFHNELSEEAKLLIGDIAPKKLEVAPAPAPADSTENKGTSAWNKAGTWEERDVSAHVSQLLKEQLEKVTYSLPPSSPAPAAVAQVTKADRIKSESCCIAENRWRGREAVLRCKSQPVDQKVCKQTFISPFQVWKTEVRCL